MFREFAIVVVDCFSTDRFSLRPLYRLILGYLFLDLLKCIRDSLEERCTENSFVHFLINDYELVSTNANWDIGAWHVYCD